MAPVDEKAQESAPVDDAALIKLALKNPRLIPALKRHQEARKRLGAKRRSEFVESFGRALIDKNRTDNPNDEGFEHVQRSAANILKGFGGGLALIPEGLGSAAEAGGELVETLKDRSQSPWLTPALEALDSITGPLSELGGAAGEQVGRAIRRETDVGTLPGTGNVVTEQGMQGAGSVFSFLIPGAAATKALGLGRAGAMGVVAAQGSISNFGAEIDKAERAGSTGKEKWMAGLVALGVGATEPFPLGRIAGRLAGVDRRSGGAFLKLLKRAFLEAGEEGAQEGFTSMMSNAVAKWFRKEDIDYFTRAVAEDALLGAALGGIFSLGIRGGHPRDLTVPPAQEVDAVPLEPGDPGFPVDPSHRLGQGGEVGFLRREGGGGQQQLGGQKLLEDPSLPRLTPAEEGGEIPASLQPIAGLLTEGREAEAKRELEEAKALPREKIIERLLKGKKVPSEVIDQSILDEVVAKKAEMAERARPAKNKRETPVKEGRRPGTQREGKTAPTIPDQEIEDTLEGAHMAGIATEEINRARKRLEGAEDRDAEFKTILQEWQDGFGTAPEREFFEAEISKFDDRIAKAKEGSQRQEVLKKKREEAKKSLEGLGEGEVDPFADSLRGTHHYSHAVLQGKDGLFYLHETEINARDENIARRVFGPFASQGEADKALPEDFGDQSQPGEHIAVVDAPLPENEGRFGPGAKPPTPTVAAPPTEDALFGEQEKEPAPPKTDAALGGQQGLLIDDQKGDIPGQQTITDLTDDIKGEAKELESKLFEERGVLEFVNPKTKERRILSKNAEEDRVPWLVTDLNPEGNPIRQVEIEGPREAIEKLLADGFIHAPSQQLSVDRLEDEIRRVKKLSAKRYALEFGDRKKAERVKDLMEELSHLAADPGVTSSLLKRSKAAKERKTQAATEGTLQDFVRGRGGLTFVGDLANLAESAGRGRPGLGRLIHPKGATARGQGLDAMGELATEAGFFAERPTEAEFLDALDENRLHPSQVEKEVTKQEKDHDPTLRPIDWRDVQSLTPEAPLDDTSIPDEALDEANEERKAIQGEGDASFDTDTFFSGFLPLRVEDFPKGFRTWTARWIRDRGNLFEKTYKQKLQRDFRLNEELAKLEYAVKDFDKQVKAEFGKKPSGETVLLVDSIFKGETDAEGAVSAELAAIVARMREHVDRISQRLIDLGLIPGSMVGRITEQMGYYATRTFKVHTDPKWFKKVPTETKNRFRAWVQGRYINPKTAREFLRRAGKNAALAKARFAATRDIRKREIRLKATAELGQLLRDTKRANQIISQVAGAADPMKALERKELGLEKMSKHAEANIRRITERLARQNAQADANYEFGTQAALKRSSERAAKMIEFASRPRAETEEEANKIMERILHNKTAADNPLAYIARGGKLGSKDLNILRRRKELAFPLRELMGENVNARTNYANSIIKMATLATNHEFLKEVRADGMGVFLFEDFEVIRPQVRKLEARIDKIKEKLAAGEATEEQEARLIQMEEELDALQKRLDVAKSGPNDAYVELSAPSTSAMAPLNGLWTTPEVKQAFEDFIGEHPVDYQWMRWYLKANGFSKLAKTVFSPDTHSRNYWGNGFIAIANGNWNPLVWKEVIDHWRGMKPTTFREYRLKLIRLGILQQSTNAGEMRDVAKDAGLTQGAFLTETIEKNLALSAGKWSLKAFTKLYQLEDDVWKMFAYESELRKYSKHRPDLIGKPVKGSPDSAIEHLVAEIVSDTVPTYARINKLMRAVRKAPFGPFVAFPAEIVRVGKNTILLTQKELADPRTRGIGMQRVAGILMAATLPSTAAAVLRALSGISEDDDENFRQFLPTWSQNNDLLHMGSDEKGKRRYSDFSYTDPYSYLKTPLFAMLRGEDWKSSLVDGAMEFLDPFVSEDIAIQAGIDLLRNKRSTGSQIWRKSDPPEVIFSKMAVHLAKAWEPGASIKVRNLWKAKRGDIELYGREYSVAFEILSSLTGTRIVKLDLRQGLGFMGKEYKSAQSDATSTMSSVAVQSGNVTDEDLVEAYNDAEAIRRDSYEKLKGAISAARGLGFDEAQVIEALRAVEVSKAAIGSAMRGVYLPYLPGSSFMRSQIKRAPESLKAELVRRREIIFQAANPRKKP